MISQLLQHDQILNKFELTEFAVYISLKKTIVSSFMDG